jgi:hypothetical protein
MVTFRRVLFFRIPVRLGWLTLKQGKDGCFLSELVGGVSEFDGVSAGDSERGFKTGVFLCKKIGFIER